MRFLILVSFAFFRFFYAHFEEGVSPPSRPMAASAPAALRHAPRDAVPGSSARRARHRLPRRAAARCQVRRALRCKFASRGAGACACARPRHNGDAEPRRSEAICPGGEPQRVGGRRIAEGLCQASAQQAQWACGLQRRDLACPREALCCGRPNRAPPADALRALRRGARAFPRRAPRGAPCGKMAFLDGAAALARAPSAARRAKDAPKAGGLGRVGPMGGTAAQEGVDFARWAPHRGGGGVKAQRISCNGLVALRCVPWVDQPCRGWPSRDLGIHCSMPARCSGITCPHCGMAACEAGGGHPDFFGDWTDANFRRLVRCAADALRWSSAPGGGVRRLPARRCNSRCRAASARCACLSTTSRSWD